jgi:hypothetical protein
VNKLLTAIVAALMIAGGLSAISGATPVPSHTNLVIVGEGSSPVPLSPPCDGPRGDAGAPLNQ